MSDQTLRHAAAVPSARRSHIDWPRLLRAMALAAWAGFFVWLWISGEMSRYLGPRTYWVIPFGATVLAGAALMHVATVRSPTPRPRPSPADLVGTVLLVAPLVAVSIVPNADLGSLAASRKSTTGGVSAAGQLNPQAATIIENPTFRDIAYAEESERYADAIGVGDGTEVELLGFVDEGEGGPEGTFELTRFYVSCCAADAIPYSVAVDPAPGAPDLDADEWAEVSGALERRGDRFVVVAESLERVAEPKEPYLY